MSTRYPIPAVSVFMIWQDQFLMMQRQGSSHSGQWGVPGGKVEFGQSLHEASSRELLEETGIDRNPNQFVLGPTVNDYFPTKDLHFINTFCSVVWSEEAAPLAAIMEPDKCSGLQWCPMWTRTEDHLSKEILLDWQLKLPQPLFKSFENYLDQIRLEVETGQFRYLPPFPEYGKV